MVELANQRHASFPNPQRRLIRRVYTGGAGKHNVVPIIVSSDPPEFLDTSRHTELMLHHVVDYITLTNRRKAAAHHQAVKVP